MTIVQAAVLGVVQGLTEFLPISSSGHLILFPEIFGWDAQGMTFDVVVHVATLCAIVVALWGDIVDLIRRLAKGDAAARRLVLLVAAATVPAVMAGGLFGSWFTSTRSVVVVAFMLIAWGVILAVADRVAERIATRKTLYGVTWTQAVLVGIFQVFALVPGTSRSGVTMSIAMLSGLTRDTAARFSFLLAIPAILGAGLLTGLDVAQTGLDAPPLALVVGALAAFASGVFAIRFLLFVIHRANFLWFAGYRILLGVLMLLLYV